MVYWLIYFCVRMCQICWDGGDLIERLAFVTKIILNNFNIFICSSCLDQLKLFIGSLMSLYILILLYIYFLIAHWKGFCMESVSFVLVTPVYVYWLIHSCWNASICCENADWTERLTFVTEFYSMFNISILIIYHVYFN